MTITLEIILLGAMLVIVSVLSGIYSANDITDRKGN